MHDPGPLGAAIVAAIIRLGGSAGFACDEPGERAGASLTRALGQLQRIAPRAVALGSHAATDLDVLIGVGVTPPVAHRLMACDRTHLVVTTDDAGLTVGPLVVPGEGACGTCADLAKVDADPDHAWLAAQCSTRAPLMADAPLAVAAMLAAHACVTSGVPAGMAWRVPLVGEITRADVTAHPACGCGAAGPVGDVEAAERARWP
ncbi:hypothetical protein [Demequina litorisediminis]|uniref:hypothetical protein n=1 Tax=Demequina litorisediminis TaxID=1849022 RepID=UPI0024E11428|nr:hypothetical protein [Demequina litorisediminis]